MIPADIFQFSADSLRPTAPPPPASILDFTRHPPDSNGHTSHSSRYIPDSREQPSDFVAAKGFSSCWHTPDSSVQTSDSGGQTSDSSGQSSDSRGHTNDSNGHTLDSTDKLLVAAGPVTPCWLWIRLLASSWFQFLHWLFLIVLADRLASRISCSEIGFFSLEVIKLAASEIVDKKFCFFVSFSHCTEMSPRQRGKNCVDKSVQTFHQR